MFDVISLLHLVYVIFHHVSPQEYSNRVAIVNCFILQEYYYCDLLFIVIHFSLFSVSKFSLNVASL